MLPFVAPVPDLTDLMICCLNPNCPKPQNPSSEAVCQGCGTKLIAVLRGRYRPARLIGRGGFGRTYLAVDVDRLNSPCVIKQFAPQTQGTKSFQKAVKLFEQEAMRLHELGEHGQIPNLLAYFEHEQYLYLVQQMVEGKTLYQELQVTGPFSEDAVRVLLEELLPLLHFIHERGVIHRDITPSNIIRRKADQKPVLIDFGVAKQFSEAILYEPGTRIGTEGYAPIEQLRSGQAYPSSDLYSLGATCLHLLTGCRPEDLYNPLEGRWMWEDRLKQQRQMINPDFARILNAMVTDLVSERYQTAQDVLRDLKRLPTLKGAVPGWMANAQGSSLFASLDQSPVSGPAEGVGLTIPTTTPPRMTVPPTRPPAPAPRSGVPSRPPQIQSAPPPPLNKRLSASLPPQGSGWQCVRNLTGHTSWVTTVAFNPKTPTLVSGSIDDTLRVWNWQTGQIIYTLEGHARGVNQVAIGAGGQVLASCGDDDLVRVWNLADGSLIHTLQGHLRDVTTVAIGVQGFLLASGSEDRTLKLWKLDKGNLLKTLTGSAGMIKTVALANSDRLLVSGGMDNKVRLWNLETGELIKVMAGHVNSVNQVAVSPDSQLIASASKDRTIRLWSVETGDLLHTLTGHTQEVNTVQFSPDNRFLVSGSSDGTLKIWDGKATEPTYSLMGHANPVYSVSIHLSNHLIASASADKTIKVWKWLG